MNTISKAELDTNPLYKTPVADLFTKPGPHDKRPDKLVYTLTLNAFKAAMIGKRLYVLGKEDIKFDPLRPILTLGDLIQETEDSLLKRQGIGKNSLNLIKTALQKKSQESRVPLALGTKVENNEDMVCVLIDRKSPLGNALTTLCREAGVELTSGPLPQSVETTASARLKLSEPLFK